MKESDNKNPGFTPGLGVPFGAAMMPAPEPPLSELLCLHGEGAGQCAHLWAYQTNFDYGNPAGTFAEGEEPRENHRICQRGSEDRDMAGMAVYECNRYKPTVQIKEAK